MGERVPFATKIDSDLKQKIKILSDETRIPQSKLIDEALEDLIKKHMDVFLKKYNINDNV